MNAEDHRVLVSPANSISPNARVGVVIPALNEEDSVGLVLKDIPNGIVRQTIVVDNGSSDRTSAVARAYGALVVQEPRRGYGSACLAGLAAMPSDIELIVFMDADYSDFPEELSMLIRPILEDQADFVLGSRMLSETSRRALAPQQRFGNRLATYLIHLFWGSTYTDLGPFRAIRRSSLEALSMNDRNFGWTVEMQLKAVLTGLRTLEIPVRYRPRVGKSKVSGTVKGTLLAGCKILFTIFWCAWRTRHYRRSPQVTL